MKLRAASATSTLLCCCMLLVICSAKVTSQFYSKGSVRDQGTNVVCATLGSKDGQLGVDNKRRVTTTTQVRDAKTGQLIDTILEWTSTNPVQPGTKYYLGEIPDRQQTLTIPNYMPRMTTAAANTGVFDRMLDIINDIINVRYSTKMVATTSPALADKAEDSILDAQAKTAGRSLFATTIGNAATADDEGEDVLASLSTEAQAEIETSVATARNDLKAFVKSASTTQADALARSIELQIKLTDSLSEFNNTNVFASDVFAETAALSSRYIASSKNTTKTMADLLDATRGQIEINEQSLAEGSAKAYQAIANLALTANASLADVANLTAPINRIVETVTVTINLCKARLQVMQEEFENLGNKIQFASSMVSEQNDDPMANAVTKNVYSVTKRLTDLSLGILEPMQSTSQPPQPPLGFVALKPGDDKFYFSVTVMYSFVADPNTPGGPYTTDTMMELVLDSNANTPTPQDTARLNKYSQTIGTLPTTVHVQELKRLSGYCSPEFVLSKRYALYTINNLIEFTGPETCTPFETCNCWFTIERERCTTFTPYSGTTVLQTLAGTGICRDQTELAAGYWYRGDNAVSDNSITRFASAENVTTQGPFLDEINRSCRQVTSPGTQFLVDSTTIRPNDGSTFASPIAESVVNDITRCTTNPIDVERRTLGISNTLPFQVFFFMNFGLLELFKRVTNEWLASVYGTTDIHVTHERGSFFPFFDVYREPDPSSSVPWSERGSAPVLAEYNIAIAGVFGQTSLPLYQIKMDPGGYQQVVTVTATNALGQKVQKIYEPLRSDPFTSALPSDFVTAGYFDCIKTECVHPYLGNLTRFIYDPPLGMLSGNRREESRRERPDALTMFTDPATHFQVAGQYPWAPPGDYTSPLPMFTVDDYIAQQGVDRLHPEYLWNGIQRYFKKIVRNTTAGRYIVAKSPTQTDKQRRLNLGPLGLALETHNIFNAFPSSSTTSTSQSPRLDEAQKLYFELIDHESTFCFETPGTELGIVSRQNVLCPNPDQVALQPISLNAPLRLDIVNGHDATVLNLTLVVDPLPGDDDNSSPLTTEQITRCTKTYAGLLIAQRSQRSVEIGIEYAETETNSTTGLSGNSQVNSSTLMASSLLCERFRLRLYVFQSKANGGGTSGSLLKCWEFTGNQTQLAADSHYIQESLTRDLADITRLSATQVILDQNQIDAAAFPLWGTADNILTHLQTMDAAAQMALRHAEYQEQVHGNSPSTVLVWNTTMQQEGLALLQAGTNAADLMQYMIALNVAQDRASEQGRNLSFSEFSARVDRDLDRRDQTLDALNQLVEDVRTDGEKRRNISREITFSQQLAHLYIDGTAANLAQISDSLNSTRGLQVSLVDNELVAASPRGSRTFDLSTVVGTFWSGLSNAGSFVVSIGRTLDAAAQAIYNTGENIFNFIKDIVEEGLDFLARLWALLPLIITIIVIVVLCCGGIYVLSNGCKIYRSIFPANARVAVNVSTTAPVSSASTSSAATIGGSAATSAKIA